MLNASAELYGITRLGDKRVVVTKAIAHDILLHAGVHGYHRPAVEWALAQQTTPQ